MTKSLSDNSESVPPKVMKDKNPGYAEKLTSISKQSGIVFSGKFVYQIVGFFTSIILARLLGPALLGKYQLGIVTVQILSIFSTLGFDRGLVRFIPIFSLKSKGKVKKLLQHNLFLASLVSVFFSIILFYISDTIAEKFFHDPDMSEVLQLFAFYIPIFTFFGILCAALRGLKRADIEAYNQYLIVPLIFLFLLGVIIVFNGQLIHVIASRIVSVIISVAIIGVFFFIKYSEIFTSVSEDYNVREYFAYSVPLLLIGALYVLIGKIDILMLGYFVDSEYVGVYSVALNLAVLLIFALQAVNSAFAPNIAELCQLKDWQNLEKLLKTLTKWIFYISLFTFIILAILRRDVLQVFGPSFIVGATPLMIVALGQLSNAFAGSTGAVLLMTGKQKWEILNSSLIIIINIILNILLIPRFGLEGAAIATAASLSIVNILKLIETYKEFKIHPYSRKYIKGTLILISSGILSYFIHYLMIILEVMYIFRIFAVVLSMGLLSVFLFFVMKLDEDDKLIFEKFTSKLKISFLFRSK